MSIALIFGEESYLVEKELNRRLKLPDSGTIESLESNCSIQELELQMTAVSLFSDQKTIVIKSPAFLLKSLEKKEVESLESSLKKIQPLSDKLLIYHNGTLDQRKKPFLLLKKYAELKEYPAFKAWEQDKIIDWIQKTSKDYQKEIDTEAAILLEQMGGNNLKQLAKEIEKLSIYTGKNPKIKAQDVKEAAGGSQSTLFQLSDALKIKHMKNATQSLQLILKNGEDPIKLLGFIVSTFRFYCQLLAADLEKKSDQEIGQILGKNPFFVKRVLSDIRKKYTLSELKNSMTLWANADFNIKSGKMKGEDALITTLVSVLDAR